MSTASNTGLYSYPNPQHTSTQPSPFVKSFKVCACGNVINEAVTTTCDQCLNQLNESAPSLLLD